MFCVSASTLYLTVAVDFVLEHIKDSVRFVRYDLVLLLALTGFLFVCLCLFSFVHDCLLFCLLVCHSTWFACLCLSVCLSDCVIVYLSV